jgi:gliding motility-associated lipoprotein GldD
MMKVSIKLFVLVLLASCAEYTPKPHGYPKIEFPEKEFETFKNECPFEFDKPVYSHMIADTGDHTQKCWYNLFFPSFDATLHLSYKYFEDKNQLDSMMEDAYKLVFKHTIKAEEIDESALTTPFGNNGVFYTISGNTATPFNFFISDEKHHYMRGAFYFNNHTERDSVMPVVDFVKADVMQMIKSLKFTGQMLKK